eukprot:26987_1
MNELSEAIRNGFWDKSFRFEGLPGSSPALMSLAIAVYLGFVWMSKTQVLRFPKKLFGLTTFMFVHNMFLAGASATLLTLLLGELSEQFHAAESWGDFICDPGYNYAVGRMTYICYLNYLLKYYELLDTVILALKGRPLIFLHYFHHPATLILCYVQLQSRTGLQWIPIMLNLLVHSFMYVYYALATLHLPCPWKQSVTVLQIVQFVLDLVACYVGYFSRVVAEFVNPKWGVWCSGDHPAGIFGVGLLTSYLVLFIHFYRKTYKTKKKSS